MRYATIDELPVTLRETLPREVQEAYLDAYNRAWEMAHVSGNQALSRESVAHQIAWDAINREFVHDEKTGRWYREGEELMQEETGDHRGVWQRIKSLVR